MVHYQEVFMDRFSGITSLKDLNRAVQTIDGQQPRLETKGTGGRYLVLSYKDRLVKTPVNEVVKKMRSLTTESLGPEEKIAGKSLCDKIISVQGKEVEGLGFWKRIGTFIKQMNNLFGRDSKKGILEDEKKYKTTSSHENQGSSSKHGLPASSSVPTSSSVPDLHIADEPEGRLEQREGAPEKAQDLAKPAKISTRQQLINGTMERFVEKILAREDFEDHDAKRALQLRDQNGNTVFHLLAQQMVDNYNEEEHPRVFDDLKKLDPAIMDVKNNAGKTAQELFREDVMQKDIRLNQESLILFSPPLPPLPELETLTFDDLTFSPVSSLVPDPSRLAEEEVETESSIEPESEDEGIKVYEPPRPAVGSSMIAELQGKLNKTPVSEAVVKLAEAFLSAFSRLKNSAQLESCTFTDLPKGVLQADIKFNKATKVDSEVLFDQVDKLHPKGFDYFGGIVAKNITKKFMKGGQLVMEKDVQIQIEQKKSGCVLHFNKQLYVQRGKSKTNISSIVFSEGKDGPVVSFNVEGLPGEGKKRSLKGVLKTLEEGSGEEGDQPGN